MARFPIELFIARRIGSRRGNRGVMTRIATLTVAIGIAVMILSVAVIRGFRHEITASLTGFGAHIQVVSIGNSNALETTPVERNPSLEAQIAALPACKTIYPFAVKGGIIRTSEAIQGVMLKGFDPSYDWSFFGAHLLEGAVPDVAGGQRNKEILISATLADEMTLALDDRVEMLFIREGQAPRRDRFKVCGIYRTGFDELDKTVIPTDIRNVQRLGGWDSLTVSGYEILARDMNRIDSLEYGVRRAIYTSGDQLAAVTIRERFPGLFDWLQAHNVNAVVIITIMVLVALLNMISALLIILLERTRMIGTLKALGMRNWPLQKVFLARSAAIVARGMVWGNLVGLALCAIQMIWHPVKLDRIGYYLSEVPIRLEWGWWALLNAGCFVVIVACMAIPTLIISYLKPDTTLRFR